MLQRVFVDDLDPRPTTARREPSRLGGRAS